MRNIELAASLAICLALPAAAQQPVQGFATERLSLAAPGSVWIAADDLSWSDGLSGALSVSAGYAHHPFEVSSAGSASLPVVAHQTFADFGFALSFDRVRLYTHLSSPLYVAGQSGTVAGFAYAAPVANLEQTPDTVSDVPLGLQARLFGGAADALRLGVEGVLIFPSATRADYLTDGTYRGSAAGVLAGDAGGFSYAARLGAHLRTLDQSPAPGGPRGSELLFGAAAAGKVLFAASTLCIGPEVFGASAFRSFLGSQTTSLEALLTTRWETRVGSAGRLALKFAAGGGTGRSFGAPQWRTVASVELGALLAADR